MGDTLFRGATFFFAASIVVLFGVMIGILYAAARPAVAEFGWSFITASDWNPVLDEFGALPVIYGTVVSALLALAISLPISLGIAIFVSEFAPRWLQAPISFLVELLAAIPSVIYGLWGLFVLIPWMREQLVPVLSQVFGFTPLFKGPFYGVSMLAGGIILAIMITPTISSIAREIMRSVPGSLREASAALGATQWETVRRVVLPAARTGILGGAILGLGRALGETMAVTMVIGNTPKIAASLLAPGQTMASLIANEFAEAVGEVHSGALVEVGLLLFAITLLLNIIARGLVWQVSRQTRGSQG